MAIQVSSCVKTMNTSVILTYILNNYVYRYLAVVAALHCYSDCCVLLSYVVFDTCNSHMYCVCALNT